MCSTQGQLRHEPPRIRCLLARVMSVIASRSSPSIANGLQDTPPSALSYMASLLVPDSAFPGIVYKCFEFAVVPQSIACALERLLQLTLARRGTVLYIPQYIRAVRRVPNKAWHTSYNRHPNKRLDSFNRAGAPPQSFLGSDQRESDGDPTFPSWNERQLECRAI